MTQPNNVFNNIKDLNNFMNLSDVNTPNNEEKNDKFAMLI